MTENDIEVEIQDYDNSVEILTPLIDRIEEYHIDNLSYKDFFERFMVNNIPVLITGISNQWECLNWTTNLPNRKIDFAYLMEKIDNQQNVPIANCNKVYFNSHEKSEMKFIEFLNYWKNQQKTTTCDTNDLLYLKDWHLRRTQPMYSFYKTPFYFASDWLNEYCEEIECDDYRFVYMGPKGTWTPFHADVFSSFSWSTNIVGTKKWIFFPPNTENKLRDRFGNLPFNIDECKYKIQEENIPSFELIQQAGQTVFVPSGWHHQVWNLDDTISVNHNWFNGCNIHFIWSAIQSKFQAILHEIDDCKEMENFEEHCQLMLKTDFGLDFQMFLDILQCIVANRRKLLKNGIILSLNECKLGRKHAIYDLKSIDRMLIDFQAKCNLEELQKTSQNIRIQIDDILKLP